MLEVTLSSMIHRDLKLGTTRSFRMFGNSLRDDLQQLKWEISCMQFGILYIFYMASLSTFSYIGIVYPWMALVLFYHQNLSSLLKGQGKVS